MKLTNGYFFGCFMQDLTYISGQLSFMYL